MKEELGTRSAERGKWEADWMTVRLGDVVEIDRTVMVPQNLDPTTRYLGLEHLHSDGGIEWSQTLQSSGVRSAKFTFGPNHILFGKLRPYLRKVVRPDRTGVCSTDILPLLPKPGFDRDFLFHLFRTDDLISRANLACSGANLPRLSPEHFRAFEFRVPRSLPSQRRLAALLDKADALRRKRQEALRLTDDFLRSTFLDMFGRYLDKNASDLFANVLAMPLNNGFFAKNDQYGSGTPVIWVDNLYHTSLINTSSLRRAEMTANDLRKYGVLEGDLLFTRSSLVRDGIGQCNVVPCLAEPMAFECHIIRARVDPKKANPRYIQALYRSDFGKAEILRRANTATMTTISQGSLIALPCPLPPIELQNRFAAIVQAIEKTASSMAATLESNNTLFSALQQRAFSGEL